MLPVRRLKLTQNAEKKKEARARNVLLLKSIESFTNDLLKCISDHEEESFVCSGLSIHIALSMCALGAEGDTAEEMVNGLHLNKNNLSIDFKNVINHLQDVRDIELIIANRIFADKSIVIKENFIHDVNDFFSSDVVSVDFAFEPKKAVEEINSWCAEKTDYKIKEILSEGDVNCSIRMILTNAIYLKAAWSSIFCSSQTCSSPFFIYEDTTINVPTMHKESQFMYKDLKRLNAESIIIPYRNRSFIFVIIKPKEIDGLNQLEMKLQKVKLDYNDRLGKKSDFEFDNIRLALPKFKVETDVNMTEYLPKLGMVEMFTSQGNFTGISEEPVLDPPIHVDKIFQKAIIEVNEIGTDADALSLKSLRGGGIPPPIEYRDFKVDRPFLYRIVDKTCNLTLFSGRVVRPTYD